MKAAVCLYDGFCNFEFSVLLESLALADCQIDYIAKTLKPVANIPGERFVRRIMMCWF